MCIKISCFDSAATLKSKDTRKILDGISLKKEQRSRVLNKIFELSRMETRCGMILKTKLCYFKRSIKVSY